MKKEQIFREGALFLQRFVVIYGFTMLATLLFMAAFNWNESVDWRYFLWCVFFSLAADVPFLTSVSSHELSEREWRKRLWIGTILSEVILMPIGYGRMWRGWAGGILFFFVILLVGFGIRAVGFGIDAHTANVLNEQIRRRRMEQKKME